MKFLLFFLLICTTIFAQDIVIKSLENNSQIKGNNDSSFTEAKKGQILQKGTNLKIGNQSTIELEMGTNNITRFAPGSNIFIKQNNKDSIIVEIKNGEIWGNINNLKNQKLYIKTDVAQMAIKGTIFSINKSQNTAVKVYRGSVECKNLISGQSELMNKGTKMSFSPVGMITDKGDINPSSKDEQTSWIKYNNKKDAILLASINPEPKKSIATVTKTPVDTNKKVENNNNTQNKKSEKTIINNPPKEPVKGEKEPTENKTENNNSTDNKSKEDSSNDKFKMGASYSLVTVDGKQYQRIALTPEIPIWRFGVALDVELFIDDSGNFSSYGWDFSNGQKTMETLFRKIYYIRFNHPEDKFYFRLGAIDNFTLGYGIAMAGFNNIQLYPATKELGLVLSLNNISPLKFTMQTMMNDMAQIKDNKFIYGARLGFAPLGMTNIPLLNNLKISGFIAGDQNVYAGLKDRDNDNVPDELDAQPDNKKWAIDANLGVWKNEINNVLENKFKTNNIDSATAQKLLLSNSDIDSAETNMNKKYASQFSNLEDKFAIVGGDIGLPIINTSALKLDIYSQYATNLDFDNKSNKVEGYGIGAPGASLQLLIFNASAEFRHYKGFFESNYFNSLYEINRAWVNPTTKEIVLKQYQLDSLDLNGFYSHAGANLMNFIELGAGYEYATGTVNGHDASYQKLYGEASLGSSLINLIPKLSQAKAFWQKDKYLPNDENFFDNTIDTKFGYIVSVELGGATEFQYQTLYYFVQNGPKRTDVKQQTQQYIGVTAKF